MIKKIFILLSALIFQSFLISCNKDGMDTTELWEKSQTRGDIITRSGTIFDPSSEIAMKDAQNRLQTGGGLLGKTPSFEFGKNKSEKSASVGFPINPYLWRGSLETISFMPLITADPFAGIIITDWYNSTNNENQRCKLNVFIKGIDLKTDNLKVNSFCQILNDGGNWIDQKIDKQNNIQLENAILNKAKKIKLSQS